MRPVVGDETAKSLMPSPSKSPQAKECPKPQICGWQRGGAIGSKKQN